MAMSDAPCKLDPNQFLWAAIQYCVPSPPVSDRTLQSNLIIIFPFELEYWSAMDIAPRRAERSCRVSGWSLRPFRRRCCSGHPLGPAAAPRARRTGSGPVRRRRPEGGFMGSSDDRFRSAPVGLSGCAPCVPVRSGERGQLGAPASPAGSQATRLHRTSLARSAPSGRSWPRVCCPARMIRRTGSGRGGAVAARRLISSARSTDWKYFSYSIKAMMSCMEIMSLSRQYCILPVWLFPRNRFS